MQYVMAVPGREFGLLSEAARQLDMIDGYLFQRPHENTVIDFTGTATADFSIAILAGLNWMTHCATLAGVPLSQQTGTLRHFRKLVTAQRWWLTKAPLSAAGRAATEAAALMLHLVRPNIRGCQTDRRCRLFGGSIDRSAQLVAAPDLIAEPPDRAIANI
jgi:hypothetical protein